MKAGARAAFWRIKSRLRARIKNALVEVIERYFPTVAETLRTRSAPGSRDDAAILAYALAHASDPVAALNYYAKGFDFSKKMLWRVLSDLQENRAPAFDRILHEADQVGSPELRLQLLIKQVHLQQTMASDEALGALIEAYHCACSHLENSKSVTAALASLLIDKAPIDNIELSLQNLQLSIYSLTEFQQLKFLQRLARAQDASLFAKWESQLQPVWTPAAKLKVLLMRYSIAGDRNAFAKLEEAFCSLDFDISKKYQAQMKSIFDQVPERSNFLNARFNSEQVTTLQALILQKIDNRKAFAYIRLGDGESYGFADDHYVDNAGLVRQELHWWGAELDEALRHELQDKFQAALLHAHLLGVPSVLRLIRDFNLAKRDEYARNSLIARLFCVMQGVEPLLESKLVLEDQSNLYLFNMAFVNEICRLAKRVYVVSGLKSSLITGWAPDTSKVEHIEIPTHRLLRNADVGSSIPGIFPHVYNAYVAEVSSRAEPGVVFLFSAGFIGKILIAEAAKNGAVALDIGQFLIPAVSEVA